MLFLISHYNSQVTDGIVHELVFRQRVFEPVHHSLHRIAGAYGADQYSCKSSERDVAQQIYFVECMHQFDQELRSLGVIDPQMVG